VSFSFSNRSHLIYHQFFRPNELQKMRIVYAGLPQVRVEALHFAPEDISGDRLLAMMKVDESNRKDITSFNVTDGRLTVSFLDMPLYMESIMALLRSKSTFDYATFKEELSSQDFSKTQKDMLSLRLSLLDSCLLGGNLENRVSTHFSPGSLTIIE
jgi:hypothetical protein